MLLRPQSFIQNDQMIKTNICNGFSIFLDCNLLGYNLIQIRKSFNSLYY